MTPALTEEQAKRRAKISADFYTQARVTDAEDCDERPVPTTAQVKAPKSLPGLISKVLQLLFVP